MSPEGCRDGGSIATGSKTGGAERGLDSVIGGAMVGSILTERGGGIGSTTDEGAMGSITCGGATGSITGGVKAMD